jgi:hypothetical protein
LNGGQQQQQQNVDVMLQTGEQVVEFTTDCQSGLCGFARRHDMRACVGIESFCCMNGCNTGKCKCVGAGIF